MFHLKRLLFGLSTKFKNDERVFLIYLERSRVCVCQALFWENPVSMSALENWAIAEQHMARRGYHPLGLTEIENIVRGNPMPTLAECKKSGNTPNLIANSYLRLSLQNEK